MKTLAIQTLWAAAIFSAFVGGLYLLGMPLT